MFLVLVQIFLLLVICRENEISLTEPPQSNTAKQHAEIFLFLVLSLTNCANRVSLSLQSLTMKALIQMGLICPKLMKTVKVMLTSAVRCVS